MTTSDHAGHKGCKVPSSKGIDLMDFSYRDACERGSRLLLEAIHRYLERHHEAA